MGVAAVLPGPVIATSLSAPGWGRRHGRADPLSGRDVLVPLPDDLRLPRDLLTHLHQLASGAGEQQTTLAESLTALASDLQDTVSGYVGVALTLVHGGQPVVVTALSHGETETVTTSLGLPLRLLSADFEVGSRAVFYSTTAGSLVDLAADLRHVLRPDAAAHASVPELDVDLPLARVSSGISGLNELAAVNRAIGMLLEQGHDPDSGLHLLRRRARAAGVPVHVVAAELLRA